MLAALLQHNVHLTRLDLAGNAGLPNRLMAAAVASATCTGLLQLNLAGCNLLMPGRYVSQAFAGLRQLDISNTAAADWDVVLLAAQLQHLTSVNLSGCRRVRVVPGQVVGVFRVFACTAAWLGDLGGLILCYSTG